MEKDKIKKEKLDDERVLKTIGQNHLVADFCLIATKKEAKTRDMEGI